jgi:hypothetical protein
MSLRAGSYSPFPENLVTHASCEALHQVIATTKEMRAGFPADQQSEGGHTSGRGHWLRIRKFVLCS